MTLPRNCEENAPGSSVVSERTTAKATMWIGSIFYIVGGVAFIVIFIDYFIAHLWSTSAESRVAFIGMLFGLFCSFQGLVFILIAKTSEARQQQTDFIINQIRITGHGG